MAEQAKLDSNLKSRKIVRTRITKLHTSVGNNLAHWNDNEISMNLLKAKGLHDEILVLDKEIMSLRIELDFSEEDLISNSESDDHYTDCLLGIISKLESPPVAAGNTPNASTAHLPNFPFSSPSQSVGLKLPPIELPKYGHKKGENLGKFFQIFDSIIAKHPQLSSHQQFLLLQQQLSGPPRILVDTLDFDLQKYSEANAALVSAFDSADKSKDEIINMLSALKLNDYEEPYTYIGKIRTIVSSVSSLNISVDDIIRHFVWKGFNKDFQNHLTNITNKFIPSLPEIQDKLFEAADRYNKQIDSSKSDNSKWRQTKPKETIANAVNIDKQKIFCVLCKADKKPYDHYMSKCPNFETAKAKVDKLRKIKGCLKCGFGSHESKDCRFKFKSKCRSCSTGDHMTYLCWKSKNGDTVANAATTGHHSGDGHDNVAQSCIASYHSAAGSALVLPTFTGLMKIGTNNNEYAPIRIFKDGGSQSSFLCRSVAETYNLPVVKDNVPLNVHGFNSSKRVYTKIVRLALKLGENTFTQNVICIDPIRTRFNVDGIGEVVEAFSEKGYDIADSAYSPSTSGFVDNIDLVLGSDADHMLPLTYCSFGDKKDIDNNSSYIETPIGVIFSGSVQKLKENIQFLPSRVLDVNCNFVVTSYPHILPDVNLCSPIDDGEDVATDETVNIFSSTYDLKADSDDICYSPDIPNIKSEMTDEDLDTESKQTLNISPDYTDENDTDTNMQLIDFVLKKSIYDTDGRLKMPLLWNNKCAHLLSRNYHLASKLLKSNFEKLRKDPIKLQMYDRVFKEQEDLGIIEKIDNLDSFLLEHPEASFLCHMGVFRMDHISTKCRIVFLSNMAEKFSGGISHNSAMLPGPNLNSKISTAVLLNRFNKYMVVFDIKKAFLSIKLFNHDSYRLCFLWYRNVEAGDFTVVGYKNVRLSFGLRNSPAILMLGLYKILMLDSSGSEDLDAMKQEIWNTVYMDNASYSCENQGKLFDSYETIKQVFEPHGMFLQQFYTNCPKLQNYIDKESDEETSDSVKFFGMNWNRISDSLSPKPLHLDPEANTKRKVLASINAIYDIYNLYAPILLRARLFLQKLLVGSENTWDSNFSPEKQSEWVLICKAANQTPPISIPRNIGARDSNFTLIAMTDASKDAYGCVIYIKDLDSGRVSYLTARSRLVSTTSPKKTIPSLELQGLAYGVEILYDVYTELCGDRVVIPVKIRSCHLFVDSMICIHWIIKYSIDFQKLQTLSVFVKNRLRYVNEVCTKVPITFRHIAGEQNTSDFLTRSTSYKTLAKTHYYDGPPILSSDLDTLESDLMVTLPNPICSSGSEVEEVTSMQATSSSAVPPGGLDASSPASNHLNHIIPIQNFSSFYRVLGVIARVFHYIRKLKARVAARSGNESEEVKFDSFSECFVSARNFLILTEQRIHYREVFDYLESPSKRVKDIPKLMSRYNLYRDKNDHLRVKSKFERVSGANPILLPKSGNLTKLLVIHTHVIMGHAGMFTVMREIRKNFWVECCLSAVKKCIKIALTAKEFMVAQLS